jgi:hypothetical protein
VPMNSTMEILLENPTLLRGLRLMCLGKSLCIDVLVNLGLPEALRRLVSSTASGSTP